MLMKQRDELLLQVKSIQEKIQELSEFSDEYADRFDSELYQKLKEYCLKK